MLVKCLCRFLLVDRRANFSSPKFLRGSCRVVLVGGKRAMLVEEDKSVDEERKLDKVGARATIKPKTLLGKQRQMKSLWIFVDSRLARAEFDDVRAR